MTIHCRILRVNLEKFSVDLTCKSSDLLDKEGRFRYVTQYNDTVTVYRLLIKYLFVFLLCIYSPPKDMYYDHDLAESDRKKEESAQKKPQQSKFNPLLPLPPPYKCILTLKTFFLSPYTDPILYCDSLLVFLFF